jgi:hypothetical protein
MMKVCMFVRSFFDANSILQYTSNLFYFGAIFLQHGCLDDFHLFFLKNVKSWDKRVNLLVVLLLVALLIVAGLDTRYGLSSIPVVLKWLGALGMIGTSYAT